MRLSPGGETGAEATLMDVRYAVRDGYEETLIVYDGDKIADAFRATGSTGGAERVEKEHAMLTTGQEIDPYTPRT